MGTRNLTAVFKDNKYIVAQYGQWDGYPSCAGKTILEFISNPSNIEKLKQKLNVCRWITQEELNEAYKKAEVPENSMFVNMKQLAIVNELLPFLNRDIGYSILSCIANCEAPEILLKDSIGFANDSLFCEYGYVIDLDKNTFEIYEGYNKKPLKQDERFYNPAINNAEYYPIKHLKTYPLNKLPNEESFLKEIEELELESEE